MGQLQTSLMPHCTKPRMVAFLFRDLPYKETFHIHVVYIIQKYFALKQILMKLRTFYLYTKQI